MAGPLEAAGALPEPSEYATLSMDRHLTGLWTQRSPLRDADVPYLYGKFYSASRFDSLIDGINREITAELTDARRPGTSVYNMNSFPAMNSFYGYRYYQAGEEIIRVVGDGRDGTVYDATAPDKSVYFTKSPTAGKARFLTVNNYLYMANGVDFKKWLESPIDWTANTAYEAGQWIVDPNGNIQLVTTPGTSGGGPPSATAPIAIVQGTPNPNTLAITCGTEVQGANAPVAMVQGIPNPHGAAQIAVTCGTVAPGPSAPISIVQGTPNPDTLAVTCGTTVPAITANVAIVYGALNLHGPNTLAISLGQVGETAGAGVVTVQASVSGPNYYLYVTCDSMPFVYGQMVRFSGLTNATWLNGQFAIIDGGIVGNRIECMTGSWRNVVPPSYGPTADTGFTEAVDGTQMPFQVGQTVKFVNIGGAHWLNGYDAIISSIKGNTFYSSAGGWQTSPNLPPFPYGPYADGGYAELPSTANGVMPFKVGDTVTFSGLTDAVFFLPNGATAIISSISGSTFYSTSGSWLNNMAGSGGVVQFPYGPAPDTGTAQSEIITPSMPFSVGQTVSLSGLSQATWLNGYDAIISSISGSTFYSTGGGWLNSPNIPTFPYGPTFDTGVASLPLVVNGVMPFGVGDTIAFSGLTNSAWLNGFNAVISSISGNVFYSTSGSWTSQMAGSGGSMQFPYGPAADRGTASSASGWGETFNSTTPDGTVVWTNKGSQSQEWQIPGPVNAPTVTATGIGPGTATASPRMGQNVAPPVNASSASPWAITANVIGSEWASQWAQTLFHSYFLNMTSCGFSIPADANIASIQVTVTFTIQGPWPSNVATNLPQLWLGFLKNGVQYGPLLYESTTSSGVSGARTFTQTVDNVSVAWTPADINASGFGVFFAWANGADSISPPFGDRFITLTGVSVSIGYGGQNTGTWQYGYSYSNSVTGDETTGSPLSQPVSLLQNGMITVSGVGSTNPQWDTVNIYRTAQGQPTPLYLASLPNPGNGVTWTYNDMGTPDTALLAQRAMLQNHEGDPPPPGFTAPEYHAGRVWGIVNNNVVYSQPLSANGFAPLDFIPLQGELPIRLFAGVSSQGSTLFVWGTINIYAIFGDGTDGNPFTPATKYMSSVGILSYDCVIPVGSSYYAFSSKRKFISLDPGAGYVEAGFPIGDQLKYVTNGADNAPTGALYDPSTAYVTWNEAESGDTGLYVSDGSVGWFRFSPVASPESGYLWSPRAVILGGTSAVQSIEVAAGVARLLIAPQSSGKILMRDTSVNGDWSDTSQVSVLLSSVQGIPSSHGPTIAVACVSMPFYVGQVVDFGGLTNASWLNGQNAIISSISGNTFYSHAGGWVNNPANPPFPYGPTADTGGVGTNYIPYPSWDVKGNIVLCQSGQVAEIAHIALKSAAVGARPIASLLLGEVSPTKHTPFDPLEITSTDPPDLPRSETMYSDRYSALQNGVCPKCDNFQLKVDYGTQNAPDELLMYEVYGAKHSERRQQ